jgi:hypothetical protein
MNKYYKLTLPESIAMETEVERQKEAYERGIKDGIDGTVKSAELMRQPSPSFSDH